MNRIYAKSIVQCLNCSKEFEKTNREIKKFPNHFCSHSCSATVSNRNRIRIKNIQLIKCSFCNKERLKQNNQIAKSNFHFCNNKCSAAFVRQNSINSWLKGESNAVSGKKSTAKYVKHYILNRDNHQCVLCKQGELHNNMKLTLELDHIDGNYLNNKPDNLRILCPNCHTQTSTYGVKNLGKSTRKWD